MFDFNLKSVWCDLVHLCEEHLYSTAQIWSHWDLVFMTYVPPYMVQENEFNCLWYSCNMIFTINGVNMLCGIAVEPCCKKAYIIITLLSECIFCNINHSQCKTTLSKTKEYIVYILLNYILLYYWCYTFHVF